MPRLIKGEAIVDDRWQWIEDKAATLNALPAGPVLVPLALWQSQRDALLDRDGDLGIWLDSNEEAETIAADLGHFSVIGLHFPAYADGRNLSNAVLLRSRFGYKGEIRAVGDVARDQLSYMRRCGFDAFLIAPKLDPEQEMAGLKVMRDYYQGDVLEPKPLFRRIQRSA